MNKQDLQRLIKIEDDINKVAQDEFKLSYPAIEYDVVDDKKLLELMAYIIPTNFSHWTYGRDYDKLRTIHEDVVANLPLEMVLNSVPPRAYLSSVNTLGVNALVVAHVIGHVHHFANNKYFNAQRLDIIDFLARASERFADYERRYGLVQVEPILDAGLAVRYHSKPWDDETDEEKRLRIFEQEKKTHEVVYTKFGDLFEGEDLNKRMKEDVESFNSRMWIRLKNTIPVEPTEDILRFVIDRSRALDDWQKDILEVNREVGRYFSANFRNKLMAEGFATIVHNKLMNRLYEKGTITNTEFGEYLYSNALVKAQNPFAINPYYVGCGLLENIEERWNKGQHGPEWEACTSILDRQEWDRKEGKGWEKVLEVIKSYTDWNVLQEFLTVDLIDKLDLYIYEQVNFADEIQLRRTKHTAEEIRQLITLSYGHSPIPVISIIDGSESKLVLEHAYFGMELDMRYATETMKHLYTIWGGPIHLQTIYEGDKVVIIIDKNNNGAWSAKKVKVEG